jgi:polar amino acid transport system ATP-binding protein
MTPMVKAEGVHKQFGRLEVLKGIDLEVTPGEVMCVIGPSGSGKSTFLRCINHLEKIDAGRLWVDGELVGYQQKGDKLYELRDREVARKRREIGMVFQRFNLFPHMTALENVMEAPVQVRREPRSEVRERARALLEQVGLAEKASAYPNQLSGGQQQRVAIARALVKQPKVLLADEPTGNLDPETSIGIMQLLYRINRTGTTVLVATHDVTMVDRMRRRVIELSNGRLVRDEKTGGYASDESTREFAARMREQLW